MTTHSKKNDAIEQLRLMAVNDVTRAIAAEGIELTYDEADDLGEVVLDWMHNRLGLTISETDEGVVATPGRR